MIEKILENIAYSYFPKGICNTNEKQKYLESNEYLRLIGVIENFIESKNSSDEYTFLMDEFARSKLLNDIHDVSVLHWQDRCLSLEINLLKGNELTKICLNISFLIPYYFIYIIDCPVIFEPFRFKSKPKRNLFKEAGEYKDYITEIESIVRYKMMFNPFPEKLISTIIPDLNFNDIRMGNFTLYNAFFLDENNFTI